jgi:protein phosphatase
VIRFVGAAETSTGQVRDENQDRPVLTAWIAGVADGMGGHRGGETAAQLAVDHLARLQGPVDLDELVDAVRQANHRILVEAEELRLRGMGTTLVAMTLIEGEVVIVNVGDSRAYRFVDGELEQVTHDHSLVEDLVRQGQLSADEARVHPQRNIVTRALGIAAEVAVDVFRTPAHAGDRYLLCSDGLFNEVEPERIAAELRRWDDPSDAAGRLVQLANDAGARDNVTCVVVDLRDGDGGGDGMAPPLDRTVTTDAAGFTAPRSGPAGRFERTGRGVRFPWVALPYALAVVVISGVAVGGTVWWHDSAYFVADVDGEVVILQGRPGGVLWLEPTVVEETGIASDELTGASRQRLADPPVGSLEQARQVVAGLRTEPAAPDLAGGTRGPSATGRTAPTTAPTTTAPTTTAPTTTGPTTTVTTTGP